MNNVQKGIYGEHLVVAKLIELGFIVAQTEKNTESIDILCANQINGVACSIQVKTTDKKSWIINKKCEISKYGLFFIFVRLPNNKSDFTPEFFVYKSSDVAKEIKEEHSKWLKCSGRNGAEHKDNDIRTFIATAKDNWQIIKDFLEK